MTPQESYYDRIRDSKNPQAIRRAMVEFHLANDRNTSLTARVFRTSRPTVNKWVHRYKERGWQGLERGEAKRVIWQKCEGWGPSSGPAALACIFGWEKSDGETPPAPSV